MIEELKKGMKPIGRKKADMGSSLNRLSTLRTVFRGNG